MITGGNFYSPSPSASVKYVHGHMGLRTCLKDVKKKKFLSRLGTEPRFVSSPAHSLVTVLTVLS